MARLASLSCVHTFVGLSLVLLAACGGKVEDFRTDDAGPTAAPPTASPSIDASSPLPAEREPSTADAASSADAGRCDLTPTQVKLVPHPGNSARCSRTETCQLLSGHGAYFLSCPDGVASRAQLWAECDETSCSCSADNFDVALGEGGHAFDTNEPRTCSYLVERLKGK